jgi:hypothetical protein
VSFPSQPHSFTAALERNETLDSGTKSQPVTVSDSSATLEEPPLASQARPAEALKDISIQVGSPAGDKVQVRLVQETGELHIAVRTGDAEMAHGLQQGLPELVNKLQESGYRTETWRPADAASPAAARPAETQNSSTSSRQGDSGSQSGGSQQQSGQRNRNQSDRPRWVQDFESSMRGGEQS